MSALINEDYKMANVMFFAEYAIFGFNGYFTGKVLKRFAKNGA